MIQFLYKFAWRRNLFGAVMGLCVGWMVAKFTTQKNLGPVHNVSNTTRLASVDTPANRLESLLSLWRKDTAFSRVSALQAVDAWLLVDPVDCINSLGRTMEGAFVPASVLKMAIWKKANHDPRKVIELAKSLESGWLQDSLIADAFQKVSQDNVDDAMGIFPTLMPHLQITLTSGFGKALTQDISPKALKSLCEDSRISRRLITAALISFGERDTVKLLEFYHLIADSPLGRELSRQVMAIAILNGDPEVSLPYLQKQNPSGAKHVRLPELLGKLAVRYPERAAEFVGQYQGQIGGSLVWGAAAQNIARSNPTLALKWLGNVTGEIQRAEATITVAFMASVHFQKNVPDIQNWVNSITDPIVQDAAIKQLRRQKMDIKKPPTIPRHDSN